MDIQRHGHNSPANMNRCLPEILQNTLKYLCKLYMCVSCYISSFSKFGQLLGYMQVV